MTTADTVTFTPPDVAPWATYIEDRHPQFKVHSKKHLAYRAVNDTETERRKGGDYALVKRGGVIFKLSMELTEDGMKVKWIEHEVVHRESTD